MLQSLTPDEAKQALRRLIHTTSNRLVKLTSEPHVPEKLIFNDIALLLRYGLALDPELMGGVFGTFLGEASRNLLGFCTECLKEIPSRPNECLSCQLEKQMEEERVDEEERMSEMPPEPDEN